MSNRKIVDKTAHANPGTPNSNRHIETLGELNAHLDRDDLTGRLDVELSPGSLRLVQRERTMFLSTENAWRREEKRLERERKRATDGAARLLYQSKKTHYLRRAAVDVLQERELAGEAKNFRLTKPDILATKDGPPSLVETDTATSVTTTVNLTQGIGNDLMNRIIVEEMKRKGRQKSIATDKR